MARACPACGSGAARTLAAPTPRALFRDNWSYRREALARLGDAADTPRPIVQCAGCGFVFAAEVPSDSQLEFVYEQAIDAARAREANLSARNMAAKMPALSLLVELAPPRAPLKVLDYGCGFGPNLQVLAAMPQVRAIGFDTSATRLRDLAARGLAATGDAAALAAHAPFDALVLDNVLEHLPDPAATLKQLRGWCAGDAAVFASVPSRSAAQIAALRPDAPAPMDVNPLEHLNYFDAAHLDAFMRRAGFRPLARSELPRAVDVGLRAGTQFAARAANAAASAVRLVRYALSGDVQPDVNARFYRCA